MSTSRASRQSRSRSVRPASRKGSPRASSLRDKILRFKTPQTSVEDETERHPSVYAAPPVSQPYPPPIIPPYPVPPGSTSYATPAHVTEPPVLRHYGREPLEKEHQYGYGRRNDFLTVVPAPPGPTSVDAEEYVEFFWKTNDLLSELARLKFALGTVGGCGPAIRAIDAIHKPLQDLQWLFGFNTYALSPQPFDPRFKQLRPKNDAFLSKFPRTLEAVSVGLGLMEKAFEDFQSAYYEDSTMYLLMCLRKRFKCEARRTILGRGSYATSSTDELKNKIQLLLSAFLIRAVESLRKDLNSYCEKGIPVISSMQKSSSTRYLNLTTIATFLSGVTASLLQISAADTDSPLGIGVNTFLFSSLTFSIASAINSLLAVTWLKSVVRDPSASMPIWFSACINKGPMLSLVTSIVFFAAALCLFVFSSSQHIATSTVTVSFAGLYTMCLFVLAVWLIVEKWNFRNVAGSSGRSLTHDSLSMAIIEKLAVWPGANFLGVGDPSHLERGRYPTTSEIGKPSAHAVWDGFGNNFLSGTESTVGGRTDGEQHYYYGRPSRSSEAGRWPSNAENHYGDPLRNDGPRTPSPPESEALGYAPTVVDGYEDHDGRTYQSAEPQHRRRRSSIPHVNDDEHDDAAQYEPPQPIYIHLPPVDSRTYETAQFLPRDDEGELEEDDTSTSDSSHSPVIIPPQIYVPSHPPPLPGQTMPAPMPTSYSERVMVIPTNPPTYVVPPGSYVAYGTQPTIGPSAQAGNYTVYHPYPNNPAPVIPFSPFGPTNFQHPSQMPFGQPFIPPLPGETIVIPPRSRSRSRERDSVHIPGTEDGRTEQYSGYDDGVRIIIPPSEAGTSHHRGRTSSYDSSARERLQTQSSRQGSGISSVQGRSTVDGRSYAPATTSQSRHPYPQRSSFRQQPRRTTSSSSQVRFARQVVAVPQRRRSTAEQSVATGEQSTTSVLSQTLTDSPEILEGAGVEEPGNRMDPSRLDVLQSRHRATTPASRYEEREHDRFQSGSRASAAEGGLGLEVGGRPQPPRRSSSTRQDTVDSNAPSAHDPGPDRPEHISENLSIIEEASRFSTHQDDLDSSDSERSAVTAPEAAFSEPKPSTD